jgi:hypothetical protein
MRDKRGRKNVSLELLNVYRLLSDKLPWTEEEVEEEEEAPKRHVLASEHGF